MVQVSLLSFPKSCLLRKSWEYKNVYDQGRRFRGNNFLLIHVPNGLNETRLGISVHGVKTAVKRNRIKRIIREFYRHNRDLISPGSDIVFAVRKDFRPDSPQEVEQEVRKLLARQTLKK